jgi:hypothetical protein
MGHPSFCDWFRSEGWATRPGMPKSFQELLAHVEVYRAVLKKWELNDVSEHTSYLNFPADLSSYVETVFAALLERHTRIINSIF